MNAKQRRKARRAKESNYLKEHEFSYLPIVMNLHPWQKACMSLINQEKQKWQHGF